MDPIADMRRDYEQRKLGVAEAGSDPMALFESWFEDARRSDTRERREVNAMTLATVAVDGSPSARMVLLKQVEAPRGAFTWYTGLDSRKGLEIAATHRAALVFWWPEFSRQVRAQGQVESVAGDVADDYFASRPLASRIGAIVSPQSRAIRSRAELDSRVLEREAEVASRADVAGGVVRPDSWGGQTLVADEIEFWQGRTGRLHDRITFLRLGSDGAPVAAAAVEAAGGQAAVAAAATEVVDQAGIHWLRLRLAP